MRIEALGKQGFIFASNKLRESVGASHLIEISTTDWVDAAVEEVAAAEAVSVTPWVKVSGRADLLVKASTDDEERAVCRDLVAHVTTRALRPTDGTDETEDGGCGLRMLGAWIKVDGQPTAADRERLGATLAQHRERTPSPLARFPRLPVVAACATSDGPAAQVLDDQTGDVPRPLSAISFAKRAVNWKGRREIRTKLDGRLARELEEDPEQLLVAAGQLEESLQGDVGWLGVVHADGNRIGDLFTHNADTTPEVSEALSNCTFQALAEATRHLRAIVERPLPLVPLIAGGDDLTVLVDGRHALGFAAAYLRAFSQLSAEDPVLAEAARRAGRTGLTASAGVAVVKPHFPFSLAYDLCEQACKSAKGLAAAAGVPALDWHVHYDSTARTLTDARSALSGDGFTCLRRPYAVLPDDAVEPDEAEGRRWDDLCRLVAKVPVLPHPEPGEALPSSQLHRLRHELVTGGPDRAERLYRTLLGRPELNARFSQLGDKLFDPVLDLADTSNTIESTRLLDFLDGEFIPALPAQEGDR
ncbi:Cas10/Cmr2 second palm domain-containing protein [Actinokineospora sp. G85]|uniref:Cas10/Cmr2 second palm domain-containing protein n=1 Tax=Actinokineospora sp. G85 TaxID=3406626 RepID=UPI003C70BA65